MNNITDKLSDDILIPYLKGESWTNPCCIDLYNVTQDKVIKTFRLSDYSNEFNSKTSNSLQFLMRKIQGFWFSETNKSLLFYESKYEHLFTKKMGDWSILDYNAGFFSHNISPLIKEKKFLEDLLKTEIVSDISKAIRKKVAYMQNKAKISGEYSPQNLRTHSLQWYKDFEFGEVEGSFNNKIPKKILAIEINIDEHMSRLGLYYKGRQLAEMTADGFFFVRNSDNNIATTGFDDSDYDGPGLGFNHLCFHRNGKIYWDKDCNCPPHWYIR
tara:strand:+ start:292 stop:1104 length:813 start_codon:yes stop_codon:yes gene_type:complete